jgi:hypothetical protein
MKIEATVARTLAMAALCAAAHVGTAQGSTTNVVLDVSGIVDMDERGADSNIVRELFVSAGATVESFEWDINLTSHDPSYLSEMQVTFSDSLGYGVTFTPGGGDDFSGTSSYAGFQDLRVLGQHFSWATTVCCAWSSTMGTRTRPSTNPRASGTSARSLLVFHRCLSLRLLH